MNIKLILVYLMIFFIFMSKPTFAENERVKYINIEKVVKQHFDNVIKKWLDDPVVYNQLKHSNKETSKYSIEDIKSLDAQWVLEKNLNKINAGGLIHKVLNSKLSGYLATIGRKYSYIYNEIIIMNNKGLNVGIYGIASDYWQGDEEKFFEAIKLKSGEVFIEKENYDLSTKSSQVQISSPILNKNGLLIGVVTIGVNIDNLALSETLYIDNNSVNLEELNDE